MVIMSNTIEAGWGFDHDDNIIYNLSIGTISSFKRSEIPLKNERDPKLTKFTTKMTPNTHTDEEGWTTTSPGRKKPRNNNN